MEQTTIQNHTSSAKDFFLHLASQVALYTIVINLGNLFFRIIDKAYPPINSYYYFGDSSISFPVALLIIVFPVFIILNYLIEKSFVENPEKKNVRIRKWLIYLTLFISGIILIGDMVTVLYFFLDGQELTAGFILKVLTVLFISGAVFLYYLGDIRDKNSTKMKKISIMISSLIIVLSIILGFSVLGSPKNQRLLKYDQAKIDNIVSIVSSIQTFYDRYRKLPNDLKELKTSAYLYSSITDEQTGKPLNYIKINSTEYKICAEFNLEGGRDQNYKEDLSAWSHPKGEYCFEQKVNENYKYNEPVPVPMEYTPTIR